MNRLSRGGIASILLLTGFVAACSSEVNRPSEFDSGAPRDSQLDGTLTPLDSAHDIRPADSARPDLDATTPTRDLQPDTAQPPGDSVVTQPDAALAEPFGGWDGHNYLTQTIDTDHNVHVSGNMHAPPLVYFRGNGDTYLNAYDEGLKSWAPLHGSAATPMPCSRGSERQARSSRWWPRS